MQTESLMRIDRRSFLTRTAASLAVGAALLGGALPSPAEAVTADAAQAHVVATVDDVLALVQAPGTAQSKAPQLRGIMEARASMPQIAQAAAGRTWREMTPEQQARFTDAFTDYVAEIYARRFQEYEGQQIRVSAVRDAGNKGMLVESSVIGGGAPIIVEWLVSDRSGRVAINDIVIEGVSLVLTQREEIAQMLASRGNDVEQLIAALH